MEEVNKAEHTTRTVESALADLRDMLTDIIEGKQNPLDAYVFSGIRFDFTAASSEENSSVMAACGDPVALALGVRESIDQLGVMAKSLQADDPVVQAIPNYALGLLHIQRTMAGLTDAARVKEGEHVH